MVWVNRHQNDDLPFENRTFLSGFQMVWVHRSLNAIQKIGPLNTGLVRYSDGYCICLKRTLFPSRFLWSSARRLLPKFWQNVTVWSPIWVTLCRNRSRFSGVRRKMAPTQRTTIAKKKTTETKLERDNYSTIGIQLLTVLWASYSSWRHQLLNYGQAYLNSCTFVQWNINSW